MTRLLHLVFIATLPAHALDCAQEYKKSLASMTKVVKRDFDVFNWYSVTKAPVEAERLLASHKHAESEFRKGEQSADCESAAAGCGVYAATDPAASCGYGKETKGRMWQMMRVTIPKGHRVLVRTALEQEVITPRIDELLKAGCLHFKLAQEIKQSRVEGREPDLQHPVAERTIFTELDLFDTKYQSPTIDDLRKSEPDLSFVYSWEEKVPADYEALEVSDFGGPPPDRVDYAVVLSPSLIKKDNVRYFDQAAFDSQNDSEAKNIKHYMKTSSKCEKRVAKSPAPAAADYDAWVKGRVASVGDMRKRYLETPTLNEQGGAHK